MLINRYVCKLVLYAPLSNNCRRFVSRKNTVGAENFNLNKNI